MYSSTYVSWYIQHKHIQDYKFIKTEIIQKCFLTTNKLKINNKVTGNFPNTCKYTSQRIIRKKYTEYTY